MISGEAGKHATSRLLAQMLQAAGYSVGLADADGVILNGRTVRTGPLSPPTGLRTVLLDPTVDAAVLAREPVPSAVDGASRIRWVPTGSYDPQRQMANVGIAGSF